jgi:extracellular factor (EF) 3-hydroxypalmitic acid methyl ester biosynthesis protein
VTLNTPAMVVKGRLEQGGISLPITVREVHAHTLTVHFEDPKVRPKGGTHFDRLKLSYDGHDLDLGPCQFAERETPRRRKSDRPVEEGEGRVFFDQAIYDFRMLFRGGRVTDLTQRLDQLPVVLGRQGKVKPAFRHLVSELRYDFQVYRGVFDELERGLAPEPPDTRWRVQDTAVKQHYAHFKKFFDDRLELLEEEVRNESRETHAVHGFFLRKQMWDLISLSEFLLRTNLKPRGYAGDSRMLRLVYEDEFRGPTVFSRFLHRHPLNTPAAEAVRNRRAMLAHAMGLADKLAFGRGSRARILSVASGSAWELNDVLNRPAAFERFSLVLVDQDPEALAEADEVIAALEGRHGCAADVTLECDSVRTMLRDADPRHRWGQFELVYAMGLFDYLTEPVARATLSRLYELVAPGGELVIGNFHRHHRTRIYMEYWMDWVLCCRTEDELLGLVQRLPDADCRIEFEPTGSQMFLRVRRNG